MHKLFPYTLTVIVVVFLQQSLLAEEPNKPPRPRPDAQAVQSNPEALFKRLDANRDGAIAQDELPANMPELFKQLLLSTDRNHDGKITLDELTQAIKNRRPEPTPQRLRLRGGEGQSSQISGPPSRGPGRGGPMMAGPPWLASQERDDELAGPPWRGPKGRDGEMAGPPWLASQERDDGLTGPPGRGLQGRDGEMAGPPWRGLGRGPWQMTEPPLRGPDAGPPEMAGPPLRRPDVGPPQLAGPPWRGRQGPPWAGPEYGPPQGPPWLRPAAWPHYRQGPPEYPGPFFGMAAPRHRPEPPRYILANQYGPWGQHRPVQHRVAWQSYGEGPQRPGFDLKAIFKRLDKNQDGQLSFEEFSQGMKHWLQSFLPGRGPRWARPAGFAEGRRFGPPPFSAMANYPGPQTGIDRERIIERFKTLDKNQDGKLSKDEAPPRIQKNFARVDVNKDGFIVPRELYRALTTLRQQREAQQPPRKEADKASRKKTEITQQANRVEQKSDKKVKPMARIRPAFAKEAQKPQKENTRDTAPVEKKDEKPSVKDKAE
jgi:Ca2+-binding EF-hand superfamily protein